MNTDVDTRHAVADAMKTLTDAWGTASRVTSSGGMGLVATFTGLQGHFLERLKETGAEVAIDVGAPSRRGGEENRHFIRGVLGQANFFARATNLDEPTFQIEINVFPEHPVDPSDPLGGVSPLALFNVTDEILGGRSSAANLLGGYIAYHLERSSREETLQMLAELSQIVTDGITLIAHTE
jgi:hypothetical protein